MTVTWLGMTAVYSPLERTILAQLPVREQTFLHALKALMEGEISESDVRGRNGAANPEDIYGTPIVLTPRRGRINSSHGALGDGGGSIPPAGAYINPDDIPFGDAQPAITSRKRPIYALVWTWQRSKVVKTKAKGTRSMRAWKKWHERKGWKVTNHAEGYFAKSPAGELRAITLHEYDAETRQRLK